MKHYIYLAGPIAGNSYEAATNWRDLAVKTLNSSKIECLSPLRNQAFLAQEKEISSGEYRNPMATSKGATRRDMWDVKRSSVVLINLLAASRVSIGSCMELAWAYSSQVPVILVMEDGNLHDHMMVQEAATFIVPTLEEAYELIQFLLSDNPIVMREEA